MAERIAGIYLVLVLVVSLLPAPRYRALGGAGAALLGLAAAADAAVPSESGTRFTTLNQLLALTGVLIVALAVWRSMRSPRPTAPPRRGSEADAGAAPLDVLLLVGLVLAALASHLLLVGFGATLALSGAARAALRERRAVFWIVLAAGATALLSGLSLTLTILGPEAATSSELALGPFSHAAERLLVLLFGVAGILLAGLPPLHRAPWGRGLAPLAAILLARLIIPAFPLGLATWQVPAMLLLVGALAWSALRQDWGTVAIAGGLMSLWTGTMGSLAAGSVLVVWGWLVEFGGPMAVRSGLTVHSRWAGLAAVPAAFAALPALAAGLRAQVLLSVIAAIACSAGLVLGWRREARALDAPLY